MAVLNLRNVPGDLAAQLKTEAIWCGMGFHEYCVAVLERREDYRVSVLREEKEKRTGKTISPIFRMGAEETDRHGKVVPQKKIAEVTSGGAAQGDGGSPGLPPMGKAQEYVYDAAGTRIAQDEARVLLVPAGSLVAADWSPHIMAQRIENAKISKDAAVACVNAGVELDREILVRWGLAANYKPKMEDVNGEVVESEGRGAAGENRRDSGAVPEDHHGSEGSPVATGKPGVDLAALRAICEGKPIVLPPHVVEEFERKAEEPVEVDLCGFRSYNEEDGEWYVCTKEKHGPKIKHGEWLKV